MLHEERVCQMVKLAVYDENKKQDKKAVQYFRRDYLVHEMIKSFFAGSIGFFLLVFLAGIGLSSNGMVRISNQSFGYLLMLVIILYGVFMGAFLVLTYKIYSRRYEEGKKEIREYKGILKKVNELYEQEENGKSL